MRPVVSIITPVYNRRHTIVEALASLQAQTMPDFEAIVVDDGSADGTSEVVEALVRSDPRIRLIRAEHRGRSAARNTGLDAARGQWLMFLDSDDLLLPGAIEHLVNCAEQSEHGAAYGEWRHTDLKGESLDEHLTDPSSRLPIGLHELLGENGFVIHSQIIRCDLVGEMRFREDLSQSEDRDFWTRLAEKGIVWAPTPLFVCEYRITPRDRSFEMFEATFDVLESAFERARAEGCADREIDVSVDREVSLLVSQAFRFSHLCLLSDPSFDMEVSRRTMRHVAQRFGRHQVNLDHRTAAEIAYSHLPLSEQRAPDQWLDHVERYWLATATWWQRCEAEGWARDGFVHDAQQALLWILADRIDTPGRMRIPSLIAERLDPDQPVVLLGFGRNGLRLATELAQRGFAICVRDDLLTTPQIQARAGDIPVESLQASAPLGTGAQHVMTVLYDESFMARLPDGLVDVRWRDVTDEAAAPIRAQFDRATSAQAEVVSPPEKETTAA